MAAGSVLELPLSRHVQSRSLLERHCHDDALIKKMIVAMLDQSESACGASSVLKRARSRFQRFFKPESLPDPTCMDMSHLPRDVIEQKFDGILSKLFHHVSQKHGG